MNNWPSRGFLAILIIGFLLMSGCTSTAPVNGTQTPVSTPTPAPALTTGVPGTSGPAVTSTQAGQSTLIIAVKDAPKAGGIGTINHLWLNISEVSVHRAASANETANDTSEEMTATESDDTGMAGWTVVVNGTHTVDLIQLANMSLVLDQKLVDAGRYTQIRVKIDSGTIMVDNKEYNIEVPGGVLRLNRGFVLEPGRTLTLTLDFNVEKSVIRTGSDRYMLKPVIAVLSG